LGPFQYGEEDWLEETRYQAVEMEMADMVEMVEMVAV